MTEQTALVIATFRAALAAEDQGVSHIEDQKARCAERRRLADDTVEATNALHNHRDKIAAELGNASWVYRRMTFVSNAFTHTEAEEVAAERRESALAEELAAIDKALRYEF